MSKPNEVAAATQSPFVEQIAEQAAEELWTYGDRTTMLRANKAIIRAAIEKVAEANITRDHQAKAWCHVVTALICDYGLEHTEPGKVALDQVLNFFRRKLPASQPQRSSVTKTCVVCGWIYSLDEKWCLRCGHDYVDPEASGAASERTPTACSPGLVAGGDLQEWTPKYVRLIREETNSVSMLDWDDAIAAAHNAALAAEREKRSQAEKLQKLTEDNEIRWMQMHEKAQTQLLQALVAIENVARRIKAAHGFPNFVGSEIADLEAVSDKALREHDAELRAQWEKEHGGLSDSIKEALNSGDGTYRP